MSKNDYIYLIKIIDKKRKKIIKLLEKDNNKNLQKYLDKYNELLIYYYSKLEEKL